MKLDTEQERWDAVFSPWEQDAINAVYKYPAGITSATLHREVSQVSRASCINFLEALVEQGFLKKVERSGKGGMHGVYSPTYSDKQELEAAVLDTILNKLNELRGIRI